MAAFDGGVLQLIELTAWGYLALACYVVVEGCLDGLLKRIHKAREIDLTMTCVRDSLIDQFVASAGSPTRSQAP